MVSKREKSRADKITAGILQFRPIFGDVEANLKIIRRMLARRKFDLVVLPELATTGYNFADKNEAFSIAETKKGKSFQVFEEISAKTGGAIVWGMAERIGSKLYNTAVLTIPEGNHYFYRKTHLFFREKEIFEPGNTGFRVFRWRGVKIGLMICFDWIFPEAARTLALKKAQIICHPSNLVMPFCQDAMITRSIENGLFCITANRVGMEKNKNVSLKFTGKSQITSPKGKRILKFNQTEQCFKSVKLQPKVSDIKKVNSYNDIIADRRVGYYRV